MEFSQSTTHTMSLIFSHSPLFYLHHANIDRIYAKWQEGAQHRLGEVNGNQLNSDGSVTPIDTNFRLTHYNVVIGNTLRTTSLCYVYDDTRSRKMDPSLAELRLRENLSPRTLERFFPKLANGSANSFDYDFSQTDGFDTSIRKPLPAPTLLPREFFEKRNFSVEAGMRAQEYFRDFVTTMNREHYFSPYLTKIFAQEEKEEEF